MKKILSLLLCLVIAFSLAACGGKEDEKSTAPDVKQSQGATKEDKAEKPAGEKEEKTSAETKVLPSATAEDLEDMVDEFNTTDDPERKEELRKELEAFLEQAEAAAQ